MGTRVKSFILLIIALLLSYYTAVHVGALYTQLFGEGGAWIGSEDSWNFIIGLPLSLIFFLTLIPATWVFKKTSSSFWLISPIILWEIVLDIRHIYIPIALIILALGLSTLLKKILKINTVNKLPS